MDSETDRSKTTMPRAFGIGALVVKLEKLKTVLHPDNPDDWDRFLRFIQPGRTSVHRSLEYRIVRPDGEVSWIHSACKAQCDIEGQPTRVVGATRNLTVKGRRKKRIAPPPECLQSA